MKELNKSRSVLLLSILAISLFASLGLMQFASTDDDKDERPHSHGRMKAKGVWEYTPNPLGPDLRFGDSYTLLQGDESGTWTGTFDGTSFDIFQAVMLPSGTVIINYALIFFDGEVDGKDGTLVISFAPGSGDLGINCWTGEWEIISGTGELENLHGRGTWGGCDYVMYYEGWIRFKDYAHDNDDD